MHEASTRKARDAQSLLAFGSRDARTIAQPDETFADLQLDGLIDEIAAGCDRYDLGELYRTPAVDAQEARRRQAVFDELGVETVRRCVDAFAEAMRQVDRLLASAGKLYEQRQRQSLFVEAGAVYWEAVGAFARALDDQPLRCDGLRELRDRVVAYAGSEAFAVLGRDAREVLDRLSAVRYLLQIRGDRVTVRRYENQPDYAAEIEETFARFRDSDEPLKEPGSSDRLEMNQLEAIVVDRVARLHPEAFALLDSFCDTHEQFIADVIRQADFELQFYLAYMRHIERVRATGDLAFCLPHLDEHERHIEATATFDLALATKLTSEGEPVVTNDFALEGPERIFVVSGPNQGGKTTFARTFGQLHHLARVGCPVPGRQARLLFCDAVFTHFERVEAIGELAGKLESDLRRIHRILRHATDRSVVVMNESFGATTLHDARFLGIRILEQLIDRDVLGVCVTFVDELASLGPATVSLMSTVDPADPAHRTFRVERRPADGRAYATVLAERHGLGYDTLRKRLSR